MNPTSSTLGILSAMITPAILILATGSLIMTTSQRLSRVIERVRKISQEFMQLDKDTDIRSDAETKRRILYTLLRKSARRSKLLTTAMTLLYVSLGFFVATSLSIGIVGVTHMASTWLPTTLGLTGAVLLFVSSAILIVESRVTFSVIVDEVDYVVESSKSNAPKEVTAAVKRNWRNWFKW